MATEAIRKTIGDGEEDSRVYTRLRRAIWEKRLIEATYSGYRRVLQPQLVGYSNGVPMLLAYQVGGEGRGPLGPAGDPSNWRCFRVDGLSGLRLIRGEWIELPNRPPDQGCVHFVDQRPWFPIDDSADDDDDDDDGGDWDGTDWDGAAMA